VAAVEPDDLHALRHFDLDPFGCAVLAPLSLLDLVATVVEEPDAVDVVLVGTVQNLDARDSFLRTHWVYLCVFSSAFLSVESGALCSVGVSHLELVQVGVGFEADAIQLDPLLTVHLIDVTLLRPLEAAVGISFRHTDSHGLAQPWEPLTIVFMSSSDAIIRLVHKAANTILGLTILVSVRVGAILT